MYFIFEAAPFIGWTINQDVLIYAIAGGVFLAFLAYWFVQNVIGGLVRKMLEGSIGEENSATLKELGFDKPIYRYLLRNGSTLRNLISCAGGELPEIKESSSGGESEEKKGFSAKIKSFLCRFKAKKYDFENGRFFISEENKEKASARHSRKMSAYWLPVILVVCAGCAFGMTFLLPIIMGFIRG